MAAIFTSSSPNLLYHPAGAKTERLIGILK
jgi:hypothetical protein